MRNDQKRFTGHASNYIYVSTRRPQAFGFLRLRILASIIALVRTHKPVAFVAEERLFFRLYIAEQRLFHSEISQGFHNIDTNVFFNISKIRALKPKMCTKINGKSNPSRLTANSKHDNYVTKP